MDAAEIEDVMARARKRMGEFAAVAIATGGVAEVEVLGAVGTDPSDALAVTFRVVPGAALAPGMKTVLDHLAGLLALRESP